MHAMQGLIASFTPSPFLALSPILVGGLKSPPSYFSFRGRLRNLQKEK